MIGPDIPGTIMGGLMPGMTGEGWYIIPTASILGFLVEGSPSPAGLLPPVGKGRAGREEREGERERGGREGERERGREREGGMERGGREREEGREGRGGEGRGGRGEGRKSNTMQTTVHVLTKNMVLPTV